MPLLSCVAFTTCDHALAPQQALPHARRRRDRVLRRVRARATSRAMMAVWAESDDIVCIHPAGPAPRRASRRCARAGCRSSPAARSCACARPRRASFDGQSARGAHRDRARLAARRSRRPTQSVFATNVYELTEDGWRMVVHHATRRARGRRARRRRARRRASPHYAALSPDEARLRSRLRRSAFICGCCARRVSQPQAADPRKVIRTAYHQRREQARPAGRERRGHGHALRQHLRFAARVRLPRAPDRSCSRARRRRCPR